MKKKYIFGLCVLFALVSCQDYYAGPEVEDLQPQPTSSIYNIPIDSALSYLNDFMADENLSRDEGRRVVCNITPIKYNMVASRADEDSINCENLLYIANFEDDAGYAILAADSRISDKVIAVIDQGNFKNVDIFNYVQKETESDRLILDLYPNEGDGFFTTPETGNELFINPNTVDLFIESEQDTLVGDFFIDGTDNLNGLGHITSTYYGDELVSVDNTTEICNLVHCDFGWKGDCNGYYVSGLFKLDDYRVELDEGNLNNKSTNYDTFIRVVTY